jgi:hypothetical protein
MKVAIEAVYNADGYRLHPIDPPVFDHGRRVRDFALEPERPLLVYGRIGERVGFWRPPAFKYETDLGSIPLWLQWIPGLRGDRYEWQVCIHDAVCRFGLLYFTPGAACGVAEREMRGREFAADERGSTPMGSGEDGEEESVGRRWTPMNADREGDERPETGNLRPERREGPPMGSGGVRVPRVDIGGWEAVELSRAVGDQVLRQCVALDPLDHRWVNVLRRSAYWVGVRFGAVLPNWILRGER